MSSKYFHPYRLKRRVSKKRENASFIFRSFSFSTSKVIYFSFELFSHRKTVNVSYDCTPTIAVDLLTICRTITCILIVYLTKVVIIPRHRIIFFLFMLRNAHPFTFRSRHYGLKICFVKLSLIGA